MQVVTQAVDQQYIQLTMYTACSSLQLLTTVQIATSQHSLGSSWSSLVMSP